MIRSGIIFVLALAILQAIAGTGPSDDPIAVTEPDFPRIANDAPPGPFFQGHNPPFPTDSWWSGFTVGNQDAVVAGPFPFQSATTSMGLSFGLSDTREFDGISIKVPTQLDWNAGIVDLPNDIVHRKAVSWDTQTVCLQYFNDAASVMDSCLVPGSPYMTFTYNNAQVLLTSLNGEITSFEWVTPDTKARVITPGGTYIIYVIRVLGAPIVLTAGPTTLTSQPGFSGTLRFVKIKDVGQEAVLDRYVQSIPTGLTMSYTVAGDVSTQTWSWDVLGNAGELLLLSWPHHRRVLQGANFVDIQYLTLKGFMKGVLGNTWVQRHDLPTISWFPENPPHVSCLPELVKTLEAEVNSLPVMVPGDFYFWGGAFGRVSRLALIAEHIGRNDLVDKVVVVLKDSIQYWFEPDHRPRAAFETGWGGFINEDGWNNTWVDFGNGYYNDHHFHYGYLLQGAATIGKYDAAWLAQHRDWLTHVARNVGNPSPNDPHYTVTRHMDFFAGHSWASGIAHGAGPRDQESSGEAINGYYGLLLFAHAINHQALIDYSRLLLAIEISGAQAYWHLYPSNTDPDTPYPEQAFRELTTVGNVMDWQSGAWLFWGDQRTQIAAIQILPLTPIGQVTYDKAWMEGVLPYCQAELDDVTIGDAFKSVIYAAYAKVDPQRAYRDSSQLFDWGTGNSASNQLYFVATQSSAADICFTGSQTPEGLYHIQDVASGKFVVVGGNGNLAATTSADVLATKFKLAFTPGGGTLEAFSNSKFVTASGDGQSILSAVRDYAAAFETFRWTLLPDDTYELTAMVNRAQVTTGPDGELRNNANSTNGIPPSKYRIVETDDTPPAPVPPTGVLKNVMTNKYVVSTAGNPTLLATEDSASQGSTYLFEKIEGSPENSPYYAIKSQETNMYVTGDQGGTIPLAVLRPEPQAWEYFQIVSYQEAYILIHVASGFAVAVQPDNTLIDNNNSIDSSALWTIG